MADSHFTKGSEVEVCTEEEGFKGAWFSGTVLKPINKKKKIFIEYHNLLADEKSSKKLREFVDIVNVRPPPPQENIDRSFNLSDMVDAFHKDAWWEGVITDVLDNGRYSVYFRDSKEQIEYSGSELRRHQEWIDGSWVPPPLEDDNNQKSISCKSELLPNWLSEGTLVEVTSDEEGFAGSWFAATVGEKLNDETYIIEYQHLRTEDGEAPLREEANIKHIRPFPPDIRQVDCYTRLQEVDAQYNDGWWCGVISKVLRGPRYVVYFKDNKEEAEYDHSQLRPHQDWVDGKWVIASKVM